MYLGACIWRKTMNIHTYLRGERDRSYKVPVRSRASTWFSLGQAYFERDGGLPCQTAEEVG